MSNHFEFELPSVLEGGKCLDDFKIGERNNSKTFPFLEIMTEHYYCNYSVHIFSIWVVKKMKILSILVF